MLLFAKDYYYYRTMTSGWRRALYFKGYGRGLVSKSAILVEKVGGATVVRLRCCIFYIHSPTEAASKRSHRYPVEPLWSEIELPVRIVNKKEGFEE